MKRYNKHYNPTDPYVDDKYWAKNQNFFEIDTLFKVNKIIPFIEIALKEINKDEINILDVGGGSGLILMHIARYIESSHQIRVNKFALDLSPKALKIQKNNNPDLLKTLKEDISQCSLKNGEIDIVLMIDVLEHVPDTRKTLSELQRISSFTIFKVPIENTISFKVINLFSGNKYKKKINDMGHIHIFSEKKLLIEIKKSYGTIIDYYYTNIFYELYKRGKDSSGNKISFFKKIIYYFSSIIFKISPKISSAILTDYIMVIAKNR